MFLVYVNNNVRDVVITHETFVKGGEKRVKNQKRREKNRWNWWRQAETGQKLSDQRKRTSIIKFFACNQTVAGVATAKRRRTHSIPVCQCSVSQWASTGVDEGNEEQGDKHIWVMATFLWVWNIRFVPRSTYYWSIDWQFWHEHVLNILL